MMSKYAVKRLHFVPTPIGAPERTACGIRVTEDFNATTPLVFRDLRLWESDHWRRLGRCLNCCRYTHKEPSNV